MRKSTLKIDRYCVLGDAGFLQFFRVVSSDYGKPLFNHPEFYLILRYMTGVNGRANNFTICFKDSSVLLLMVQKSGDHRLGCIEPFKEWDKLPINRIIPGQIIATSHDLGPQKVAEEGTSLYFGEI